MNDNSDKCVWLMEIIIFSCLSLSLAFASLTTYLSYKSDYLPRQYDKNWNMNYLIDVLPTIDEVCPEGYETKIIGKWSGFDGGCYCSNNQTGIQIATDEECSEILNDIFTCYPLLSAEPMDLIRYKGFQFCVKRANDNYMSLFRKVSGIYNEGEFGDPDFDNDTNKDNHNDNNEKHLKYNYRENAKDNDFLNQNNKGNRKGDYDKYSDYIKIMLNSAPPNYLDENAIIDLKLLNTKIYNVTDISQNYLDLSNYEEKKISNSNYSLFTLRLRALNRSQNILDLQRVLVDVHLYNELWCAYLDISSTYLKSKSSKDNINYGDIDYCEGFYFRRNSSLTFNDNFINSIRLNFAFDNSASLNDFYDYNGVTEFYNSLKTQDPANPNLIKNSVYGNFEPIMTAQKYFFGIGCLYSKEPYDHIRVLNSNFTLARLSGAIAGMLSICFFIAFVYVCAKGRECGNLRLNAMFLLFILMFICVLNSFAVDLLTREALIYLQDYMIYCQTDYSNNEDNNALKVSDMENNLFEMLLNVYRASGSTSTSLFFGTLMLFVFLCRECRKKRGVVEPSVDQRGNIGINQFDLSGLHNNPINNYNNNNNNVGNRDNRSVNQPPMEIEINVIGEKYNSNNTSKPKEKPVENRSSFAGGIKENANSKNYLNNNNNNVNDNSAQGNFGYSNNFEHNNNLNPNNNFDHTGFEFSEGDASRKGPAAFSNRDAPAGSNDISSATDRSNINFNKY